MWPYFYSFPMTGGIFTWMQLTLLVWPLFVAVYLLGLLFGIGYCWIGLLAGMSLLVALVQGAMGRAGGIRGVVASGWLVWPLVSVAMVLRWPYNFFLLAPSLVASAAVWLWGLRWFRTVAEKNYVEQLLPFFPNGKKSGESNRD
jgi:hypothetical protein